MDTKGGQKIIEAAKQWAQADYGTTTTECADLRKAIEEFLKTQVVSSNR